MAWRSCFRAYPFLGGGARPNAPFKALWSLAGIKPSLDVEIGEEESWAL
jgi:hypothetical protein